MVWHGVPACSCVAAVSLLPLPLPLLPLPPLPPSQDAVPGRTFLILVWCVSAVLMFVYGEWRMCMLMLGFLPILYTRATAPPRPAAYHVNEDDFCRGRGVSMTLAMQAIGMTVEARGKKTEYRCSLSARLTMQCSLMQGHHTHDN